MARRDFLRHLGFELHNAMQTNKSNMEKLLTESEKVEQLMRPRIKVIALWPFCRQHNNMEDQPKVGEVFDVSPGGSISNNAMTIMNADKYPHLFRKLEWWADRMPEEMPEYVKWVMWNEPQIEKVNSWRLHGKIPYTDVPSQVNSIRAEYFEPATESEYNEYLTASRP